MKALCNRDHFGALCTCLVFRPVIGYIVVRLGLSYEQSKVRVTVTVTMVAKLLF